MDRDRSIAQVFEKRVDGARVRRVRGDVVDAEVEKTAVAITRAMTLAPKKGALGK
jgi:hypothetical protein